LAVGKNGSSVGKNEPLVGKNGSLIGKNEPLVGKNGSSVGKNEPLVGKNGPGVGRKPRPDVSSDPRRARRMDISTSFVRKRSEV
jgi:hypothetical protein